MGLQLQPATMQLPQNSNTTFPNLQGCHSKQQRKTPPVEAPTSFPISDRFSSGLLCHFNPTEHDHQLGLSESATFPNLQDCHSQRQRKTSSSGFYSRLLANKLLQHMQTWRISLSGSW